MKWLSIQNKTGRPYIDIKIIDFTCTQDGQIDFGSMVGYLVPKDSLAGNYQIEISTRNGIMAEPVQFSIISTGA